MGVWGKGASIRPQTIDFHPSPNGQAPQGSSDRGAQRLDQRFHGDSRSAEHHSRRAPPLCTLPFLFATLFTLGSDGYLIHLILQRQLTLWLALPLHLLACTLPAAMVPFCRRREKDCRLLYLASLTTLALGPVGALGSLYSGLTYVIQRRTATPFYEWYETILPDQTTTPQERLMERLRAWGQETESLHREPVPFNEVLTSGSRRDKQAAIALMARQFNPAFAPAFRQALHDPDNAVRVQTASAITRIEDQYHRRGMELEKQLAMGEGDIEILRKLAQHYDEHASAGLADADTLAEHRRKAEHLYEEIVQRAPDDVDSLWALGRLYVRCGRIREAAERFEQALAVNDSHIDPRWRVWYWECLFSLGRYQDLREEVRAHYHDVPRSVDFPPALLDSIELWSGDCKRKVLEAPS